MSEDAPLGRIFRNSSRRDVHPIDCYDCAQHGALSGQDKRSASFRKTRDQVRVARIRGRQDLSAEAVAAKIGSPPEQLFKTLAVGDRNGIYLAVISGNDELDFKALAHDTGDHKVEMVPLKEVQAATGNIRGGVTALACKKNYPVYVDERAQIFDVISVSAGIRGLQILLAPEDYIRAVKARVVAIARRK